MGDCIVVGAGLAGAAAAASLARRGWRVRVLDRASEPAQGASALPAGLLAPHYSADDNILSQLSRIGVSMTLDQARALLVEGRDWAPCGALEHRIGKAALPASAASRTDATPAQIREAHLPEGTHGLWHAHAAWVRPSSLVKAWLAAPGIAWRANSSATRLQREGTRWQVALADGSQEIADTVVIAAALDSRTLVEGMPLNAVRGQITCGPKPSGIDLPGFAVNGHGHFIPRVPHDGSDAWFSGSTFERGDTDTSVRDGDHGANLERLRVLVPSIAEKLAPQFKEGQLDGWAGVRCASADRRPIVGEVAPSLLVSTAMGSRGLTFCVLAAELLATRLAGEPPPLPPHLADALSPARFQRGGGSIAR